MINPSINGWIDKFFILNEKLKNEKIENSNELYFKLRKTGIIYGHTVSSDTFDEFLDINLSNDELTKIVFLEALFGIFSIKKNSTSKEDFLKLINTFYKATQKNNYLFLKKLFPNEENSSLHLESIISNRIQTNQNVIAKSFSHIVTNALLFLDVIAFHNFIDNEDFSKKYFEVFEKKIFQMVCIALSVKKEKTSADELLIKLFENSLRYSKVNQIDLINKNDFDFDFLKYDFEKLYFFDLVLMALWSDKKLDKDEIFFINEIATKIDISDVLINDSLIDIHTFITNHKKSISYFNDSNPIKHFYNQTNSTVIKLITRNKKRLTKEIGESKELMLLLAKSTSKDLSDDEKKKVKKQLLDICKTIPSLTIFLLPGGGILLPILVKYIPQLLPSAFNENLED